MIVVSHAWKTVTDEQWAAAIVSPAVWALWKIRSNLYVGVPLFFVISGYCIAATAEGTLRKGGSVATYFRRRLHRIFPPYWAICAICVVLVVGASALGFGRLLTEGDNRFPYPTDLTALQWLGNVSLTEVWRYHVTGSGSAGELLFFGPSWTLGYEEQFYAVCGLLLWLAPRRFWAGILGVSGATLAAGALAGVLGVSIEGFFFDGRWLIFAAGLLVYYHLNHASPRGRRLLFAALVLAFLAAAAVRYGVMARSANRDQKVLVFEIVVGCAFGLGLILLHPWDARLADLPALRPIRFCGEMCYSLYLVHWPVVTLLSHWLDAHGIRDVALVTLVSVPLAMAVSVALARVFYLLVERRFLNVAAPPSPAAVPA
jgi:peptidoglycan/LPS O-acetylase OafA/YrhL